MRNNALNVCAAVLASGYAAGRLCPSLMPTSSGPEGALLMLAAVLLIGAILSILVLIALPIQKIRTRWLFGMLMTLSLATGWMADEPARRMKRNLECASASHVVLIGHLDNHRSSWVIQMSGRGHTASTLRLVLPGALADERLHAGDRVIIAGTTQPISPPSNPGSFNQMSWMIQMGWAATVKATHIRIRHDHEPNSRARLRAALSHRLDQLFPAGNVGALVKAMVLADRTTLDEDLKGSFRQSGLMHLLAVSGLHFGCVLFLVWLLAGSIVRRLPLRQRSRLFISSGLVVLFAGGFATLAGWSPSVIRAFLMLTIGLLCRMSGRRGWIERSLLISAFIVMLLFPLLWRSVGTQLSFAAVTGISLSLRFAHAHPRLVSSPLMSATLISTGAFMGTLPVLLWHMGWVPLVALLVSPPAVALTSAALLMAVVSLLLPVGGAVVAEVARPLFSAVIHLAEWATALNMPSLRAIHTLDAAAVWVLLFGFSALTLPGTRKFTRTAVTLILISFATLVWLRPGSHDVIMLDVGQGDALIVDQNYVFTNRTKRPLIVDTGASTRAGDVTGAALQKRGQEAVDVLLSHGDLDHTGGLEGLAERIEVKHVWTPWRSTSSELSEQSRLMRGQRMNLHASVRGYVLHPSSPGRDNHHSLVILLLEGKNGILLTGDIDERAEERVVKDFGPLFDRLSARVLKVAHHGSATSTGRQLMNRFRPDVALISAGANNRFGHPDDVVVKRLEASGAIVLSTADHGAIRLSNLGGRIRLHGHGTGRWRHIPVEPRSQSGSMLHEDGD